MRAAYRWHTAGGKSAGSRLYMHNHVDHDALIALMETVAGSALLTYDDAAEVRSLAYRHGFCVKEIPMKNAHHNRLCELALTNRRFELRTGGGRDESLLLAETPPRRRMPKIVKRPKPAKKPARRPKQRRALSKS